MSKSKPLDELPVEILLHIFGFIPNKWNLSLVCWKFYEIVAETEKGKFCLKLIDVSFEIFPIRKVLTVFVLAR